MPNKSQKKSMGLFSTEAQRDENIEPVNPVVRDKKVDLRHNKKNWGALRSFMANAMEAARQEEEDYQEDYGTDEDNVVSRRPR